MKTVCIIPVRGGSKGIPRKNLAELVDGVSLLEWTLRQATQAYGAEDVFVSTEDLEMSRIASARHVPVVARPPELAQDDTTTASVVEHLLQQIDPAQQTYSAIAILQVTSPLRTVEDILASREMIASGRYDSVVSAYEETGSHPAKMYFWESDTAVPVAPAYECSRRQDLPKVFRRNGAIFVVTRQHFIATGRLWGGRTGIVQMPKERSVDIDAPADLEAARRFLAAPGSRSAYGGQMEKR